MKPDFEPKILSFLCNWCSYAGADFAGVSRFQYPPNIRVIRTMCSGRVDPVFVLQAFLSGFDAVLVLGCHPGDCHYINGNYHAEKKMHLTRRLLAIAGVSHQRLHLDWVSAAEGMRFAQIVTNFTNQVRELGPLGKEESQVQPLKAAKAAVQQEKLRWLVGRELDLIEKGNVFGEKMTSSKWEALLDTIIQEDYKKMLIANYIEQIPRSVKEIAGFSGLTPVEVSSHLVNLEEAGQVCLHSIEGRTPRYVKAT
jgi:coenzyme F420-reducing hydrogenase delta subunit